MNDWLVWLLQFILPRRYWYRRFYLRSEHWRKTRLEKHKKLKRLQCDRCKKKMSIIFINNAYQFKGANLDVHHLRYYRDGRSILWHERPEDLQVLCRKCHRKEHA